MLPVVFVGLTMLLILWVFRVDCRVYSVLDCEYYITGSFKVAFESEE